MKKYINAVLGAYEIKKLEEWRELTSKENKTDAERGELVALNYILACILSAIEENSLEPVKS